MSGAPLVEHFFRHEYSRLVATLVRRAGVRHLADAEDAVQAALATALERWRAGPLPANPSAWLFRVAYHNLLGELRRRAGRGRLLEHHADVLVPLPLEARPPDDGEIRDDLLRMLFACCDETLPPDSQLALALKTLCGFDVREIALRLFTTEANIYKRIERARARLRESPFDPGAVTPADYPARLPVVHRILYLLFTEGHLSAQPENAMREELCAEAIRLTTVLADHPTGQSPATFALLALMHLHLARAAARQGEAGGLLLLEEQDRTRWDRERIALGLEWLAKSATGDALSRYHAEAGIAAEHCLAPTFAATRWERVTGYYALLEQAEASALHRLNRAVALAEWQGPAAGLALLEGFVPPGWLAGSYQWAAVLADLNRRNGHVDSARRLRASALELAPTPAIRELLRRRLAGPPAGPGDHAAAGSFAR